MTALILASRSDVGTSASPKYSSTAEFQLPLVRLTDKVNGGAFDERDAPPRNRQVDIDRRRQQRGGDHKDDQQHQHQAA
jgi:hypothetical protein